MVDVDNLSDAQIKAKLLEFGYPVMPITGTTRKTLQRKLKILMENKEKVGKDNRRSLGRYSSEDESDSEVKLRKNKRATMAAPLRSPSPKVILSRQVEPPPLERQVKTTTTTTRTTKILQAAKDDFDTGSESDEVAEKYSSFKDKSKSPKLPPSFLSASSAADAASDRISQIRSRLSSLRPLYPNADELLKDKESTPFLSNFTKRLSQLSESPKSYDYKSDIIKENDLNGSGYSRNYLSSYRAARGRPSTYDNKWHNQSFFKNNVPLLVLIGTVFFFVVIGVAYLSIRSDTALDIPASVPICARTDPKMKRYVNCLLEGEAKPAVNLLKVVKPELDRRALRRTCSDQNFKPYMTEGDVIDFIKKHFVAQNETRISHDLGNLEVLVFANPSWGVGVLLLERDGDQVTSQNLARDMEQVNAGKHLKVTALISLEPYVPWNCYLYNTFATFISILTSVLGSFLVLFTVNYCYKRYKNYQQHQRDEEVAMVENIIDILQSNSSEDNAYMVINHVRDMILPINERKTKEKLWKKAVKYIEENDSRIRTETQMVRGEPFEVWRWLGGASTKNKSWQGQAFETQVGSINSLPFSPTPCLKIRGMVQDGETNSQIKKTVLGKCADQCRILHCGVDPKTNCVYIKCADTSDAAVVYRNFHGWWFAGNLVTVKYLKLERYMQRFPDSPVGGPPYLQ